ncbi:hypothetical protein [Virgibacillus alimentarius]|uniref:hypothetical protein n=1 Tax=Virgibacillus alimentarius TaxID=698769 RepID=UPI0004938B77|nr:MULTISPECIES: hypothetical protein [Virgibacillus]HLR67626.1 hypothetical protein [Virgibacillus sp.]
MGLFMNSENPGVFKNEGEIKEPNQGYFKINYFSELLKRQEEVNASLLRSLRDVKLNNNQQEFIQDKRWKEMNQQLEKVNKSNAEQKEFKDHTLQWQKRLDNQVNTLGEVLEDNEMKAQEMIEEMRDMQHVNKDMLNKLDQQELTNQHLISQVNEFQDVKKQVDERALQQDLIQEDMLERLENQEAGTEKIIRQLDNLRSILYERTNDLTEQIENGYELTATYFYKLLTGSNQPVTLLMMNEKKEESKSNSN